MRSILCFERFANLEDVARDAVLRHDAPRPFAVAVAARVGARCTEDREAGKGGEVEVGLEAAGLILLSRGGTVGMKTLVPLTAPLAARALVVIAYFCLHLVRFAASSCRYRMRSALSLAEPTHGGRFLFWLSF